jgi:hypothetical protein
MANGDELQAELNCFFISAGRHDKDRVELQFGFDGLLSSSEDEFSYIVDSALFVPKSLGLSDFEQSVRQDFQSYVRLHSHVSNPDSLTSFARVDERLKILKAHLRTENLRNFAIDFQGFLKANDKKIRTQLRKLISKKEVSPQDSRSIEAELTEVLHLLDDFRSILRARHLDGKRPEDVLENRIDHDLILLNEYISHLFVQYLGDLYTVTIGVAHLQTVAELLAKISTQEAHFRIKNHYVIEERTQPDSSKLFDLYPRRIGILKKYFQSPLFVKDSTSTLERRLLVPVYGMAAAMAASWAIMVQLYQYQNLHQRVGINSIALIAVGVMAYVAKDLMKDFMRRYLMKKGGRWFPDETRKLFLVKNKKQKNLGKIGESIRVFDSEKLPLALKNIRYKKATARLERELGEDILHLKKRVTLDLNTLDSQREFPWGFREIIRIKLDRYMTQMDDAFKKMYFVSQNGFPSTKQTHRVYHLHLATWIQAQHKDPSSKLTKPAFKVFLLTIDKTGILSCEALDWVQSGEIPPTPDFIADK